MFTMKKRIIFAVITVIGLLGFGNVIADGWFEGADSGSTKATNVDSIVNSRHNLTMSYTSAQNIMDRFRNNYYEVCVYCHTPHGANSTAAAPLWNRTVTQRNYTLFSSDTAQQEATQPGPNSLTCLSCHDGATAIDSVINMPTQLAGAFRAGYSQAQETFVNSSFLDQWSGNLLENRVDADGNVVEERRISNISPGVADDGGHAGFATGGSACLACHNPESTNVPDFRLFVIGGQSNERVVVDQSTGEYAFGFNARDGGFLADDHPIGVRYPTEFGAGVDYNEPDVAGPKIAFFDLNANNHADPNEVRLYDTGDGYEVECASCHDPHGVPAEGSPSGEFSPSFLRVGRVEPSVARPASVSSTVSANAGSELCLTCHVK